MCCLQVISEPFYFLKQLGTNCVGHSEQLFGSGTSTGDGYCVVPQDPFSLLVVGIYQQSPTSKSTMLVDLAQAFFESEK